MISLYEVGLFPDSSPLFRSVHRFLFSSAGVWRLGLRHQRALHHQLMRKKYQWVKRENPNLVSLFWVFLWKFSDTAHTCCSWGIFGGLVELLHHGTVVSIQCCDIGMLSLFNELSILHDHYFITMFQILVKQFWL